MWLNCANGKPLPRSVTICNFWGITIPHVYILQLSGGIPYPSSSLRRFRLLRSSKNDSTSSLRTTYVKVNQYDSSIYFFNIELFWFIQK